MAFTIVYTLLALLAFLYIVISYRAADVIVKYHLTVNPTRYFQTHIIKFAVEFIIWVIIARSAVRLKMYTHSLKGSKDGEGLSYIANALFLGLLYSITFTMASTLKTLFYKTAAFKTVTILTNLIPIAFVVVLSVALLIGSMKLNRTGLLQQVKSLKTEYFTAFILYAAALLLYGMYLFRVAPSVVDDDGLRHFAERPSRLVLVYVLPYGLAWLIGIIGTINLAYYAHHVEGRIYRLLFRDLYSGILLAFTGTFLLQIFTVSELKSNGFGVGLVVFVFLISLIIWASTLIYRGTTELYKLEQ